MQQVIKIQAVRLVENRTPAKFVYKNIYLKSRWQVGGVKGAGINGWLMAGFMNVMAWNAAMAMKKAMIIQNIQITFTLFTSLTLQPVVPFL